MAEDSKIEQRMEERDPPFSFTPLLSSKLGSFTMVTDFASASCSMAARNKPRGCPRMCFNKQDSSIFQLIPEVPDLVFVHAKVMRDLVQHRQSNFRAQLFRVGKIFN